MPECTGASQRLREIGSLVAGRGLRTTNPCFNVGFSLVGEKGQAGTRVSAFNFNSPKSVERHQASVLQPLGTGSARGVIVYLLTNVETKSALVENK